MAIESNTDFEDDQAHLLSHAKYYAPKVLNPVDHRRLVLNLPMYATQAGIPEHFIYHSSLDVLNKKELKYLKNWSKHSSNGISGCYYEGDVNCIDKMYAMCGVLTRNFKEAKFLTLQDLIAMIKAGNEPKSRLICIPNFAMSKEQGGNVPTWELANVFSWLLNHHTHGRQAVLYFEDISLVEKQYGGMLRTHIENHFINL